MSQDAQTALLAGQPTLTLHAEGVAIELVRIPAGEFLMGSPPDEPGRSPNEGPPRVVRISRPFYLGRFEITQGQYRAVMGSLPPQPPGDTIAAAQITYSSAVELCRRLSERTGVEVALPTEAQWEYACRAGTQTAYWSGPAEADLDRVGWYRANAGGRAHAVGEKPPNAWGLYDVHGNVWEYCADFIRDPATAGTVDPVGERSDWRGAMRGGGWMHGAADARAARRMVSDDMFGGGGVRVMVESAR